MTIEHSTSQSTGTPVEYVNGFAFKLNTGSGPLPLQRVLRAASKGRREKINDSDELLDGGRRTKGLVYYSSYNLNNRLGTLTILYCISAVLYPYRTFLYRMRTRIMHVYHLLILFIYTVHADLSLYFPCIHAQIIYVNY
jgi:hypothetical protein